jgi:hypothetical protein
MRSFLFLFLQILLIFSLISGTSTLSFTESSKSILYNVYVNGDEGEDGDDQGDDGDDRGGGHGRRGGGGDDDDRDEDDDQGDDGELHIKKFFKSKHVERFFNFKQLERDDDEDDSKKEKPKPKPKTYDGYEFEADGDKEKKEFNFAAVADFACSKNTKKTIDNIEEKQPELVLALGDLSVDNTADCWFNEMSPLKGKIMITLGYHEMKGGKSKLNQYTNSFDLDKLYYSFNYENVHFITMSTLSPFNVTDGQYKFIEKDLKKASENDDIDWIVVTSYGPFYTSPSKHPAKNDIRNIYHPLFDRYGVDLVLQGHNHNYQRTYPVIFNPDKASKPTVTNTFTTGYNGSKDGIVYAIVGTAGEGFHPLEGQQPYIATQFGGKLGFLDIQVSNGNPHTNMTGTFYDNKGSNVTDHFTIEKEINGKGADVEEDVGTDVKDTQKYLPQYE